MNNFIFSFLSSILEGVLKVETQPYRAYISVDKYLPFCRAKGSASNTTTSYCLPPVIPTTVLRFLQKYDLDLICRAHQVVEDGYEFFSKRQLVTLFSAPNYCGEFDNAGVMMIVDESLLCSFQVRNSSQHLLDIY